MSGQPALSGPWTARYGDGRTAIARPVSVSLEEDGLVLRDERGDLLGRWPTADIRLVDSPDVGGALRLACRDSAERLTILTAGALPSLERRCRRLHGSIHGGPSRRAVALWSLAAAAAAAFLFVVAIPFLARHSSSWVPPRLEEALGTRTADSLIDLFTRLRMVKGGQAECTNPAGRAALDRLAGPLIAAAHLPRPPRIRVINVKVLNAVALPGGQILVFKTLIEFSREPNEVAGVLAHELAHLALGHPTEIVVERSASAFLVGLLLGDVLGGSVVAGLGQAAIGATYSRDAERAADASGVAFLEAAGLDPRPFGAFFKRLAAREGPFSGFGDFLNSHPASEERAHLIDRAPSGGRQALDAAGWQALKRICD